MAFEVLLVVLAMLLTTQTERSQHLSTRGGLCLCPDRVFRLSPDSEASSFVSCKDKCTIESNAGVPSYVSRRHLRPRRALDVLAKAAKCEYVEDDTGLNVKNKSVTFHESENSTEWYAQVTWSPFTETTRPWIGYYLVYLTGEQPVSGARPSSCLTLPKNQTSVNITSSGHKKKIYLNVVALPMFLNSSTKKSEKIETIKLIQYAPTAAPYTGTLLSVTLKTPTENKVTVITYVSISIGIVVGVALGAGLLVYFMCRKKSSYFPPEFKYHAFIIYNNEDSHWVSKELLTFLEEEHNIKCCIHYRDFTPGVPFTESMAESVAKSYKIIAVFSSNFLQSNYCGYELDLAQYRLLNRRDDCLIIVRIDKTDPSNLPRELRKRNFIDYADALERPFWKTKLLKFLNSGSESITMEQDHDNNNGTLDDTVVQSGYRQTRTAFDRLNSTTSNATEISIVDLNEEILI